MKQESSDLIRAYARRVIYSRSGRAAATLGMALLLTHASAQDTAPQKGAASAGKATTAQTTPTTTQGTPPVKPGDPGTIRITPTQIIPAPAPGAGIPGQGVPGPGAQPGGFGGFGNRGRGAFGGQGGGTRMKFDFHGADITNVLQFFSRMSGQTIIADSTLSGQVTIISPSEVDLNGAFTILQSVLAVRGFTAIQGKDNVISILPFAQATKNTTLLNPGLAVNGVTKVDPRNQVMTQVIPLENVDAEAMARELQPLLNTGASLIGSPGTNSLIVTDLASNVERFIDLAEALDKRSNQTDLRIYPLKHAEATGISDIINNLFKQTSTRGRAQTGQPGQPGQPQQPGQPGGAQGGNAAPAVVAVPDLRTNSVMVIASPDNQVKIAREIISRLDGDETNTLETQIRKINYADATTVASLVNQVLSSSRPGGSGGSAASFGQRTFGGGGGFFGGFGGFGGGGQTAGAGTSTDPLASVAADARTNSVVITATAQKTKEINALIDQLDKDVPVEPTTFVYPLKNAQAADVSYALGQAFGTGNQSSGGNTIYNFGGSSNSNSSNGRQQIQRRLGGSTTSSTGRGVGRPPGPPPAPDFGDQGDGTTQENGGSAEPQGISGVMTDKGFVPTEPVNGAKSRQFGGGGFRGGFGGFGGGFGGGQTQNQPLYGRGSNGTYSNLLQLQGKVYVTPSPGGDSVIVTTTPDNYQAVKQIIEALDTVQPQVLIEVIVAEVNLTKDQKLGYSLSGTFQNILNQTNTGTGQVNFTQSGFNTGTTGNALDPLAGGLQFVINGASYTALLQAIQTDSKIKVMATPRIFTSNNQQAEIDITQNLFYLQGTNISALGTSSVNAAQLPVGYVLNVTPRITRQGLVTIDVQSEASDLLSYQTLGSGANASQYPIVNDRFTNTEVTIQDGQTAIIGGLIRDTTSLSVNKIPFLADIPLIGQLFRSREVTRDKTELMIFLTPHVVTNMDEARALMLKQAAPVVNQIPDLINQEPNFLPLRKGKATQVTPKQGRPKPTQPNQVQPNQVQPNQVQPGQTQPGGPLLPSTGSGGTGTTSPTGNP